ncbi:putative beta-ketoacyl-[acyl-carrier-protein] synthase III [Helianthus debilis subsp. tardiflorus]
MANASVILTAMFKLSSSIGINQSGLCSPKFVSERVRCSGTSPKSAAPRPLSKGCKLVGCGSAVPKQHFSSDDLVKIVDTSDEWISSRTGILNRHILTDKNSKFGEPSSSGHNWVEVAAKREGTLVGRKITTISDATKGGHKAKEGILRNR